MRVLERSVRGEHPDERRCGDVVVAAGRLVAVVDGATDKAGIVFPTSDGDVAGVRFAGCRVVDALAELTSGTPPAAAVAEASRALDEAIVACVGELEARQRPSASVAVDDHALREVWRVGDCRFRVDAAHHPDGRTVDRVADGFRAGGLAALDDAGDGDAAARGGGPGREAILPLLRRQGVLANRPGAFGDGVVNGEEVPEEFVEQAPVAGSARGVVLASDGYPTRPAPARGPEPACARALASDPRCVDQLRSAKGLAAGRRSFDDRAWARVGVGAGPRA